MECVETIDQTQKEEIESTITENKKRNKTVATKPNIHQRMLKAQTAIKTVAKNLNVGDGKVKYKAVSERDILDAVKIVEKQYGIHSYPSDRKIVNMKIDVDARGYERRWVSIEVYYNFVNVDDPKDFITIKSYGDGVDNEDKAPGMAMTYADKYALMKAYKISTGDDPDQRMSREKFVGNNKKNTSNPKKTIEELSADWVNLRNHLEALEVDVRDKKIIKWIADKTGYPNQDLDENIDKMTKVNDVYRQIIKEKSNG